MASASIPQHTPRFINPLPLSWFDSNHEIGNKVTWNIFEYAPLGMALIDASMKYLLVNNAFCQMLGYTRDDLKTLSPLDITYKDDISVSQLHLEALIRGDVDVYQMEKRYVRKCGSAVWILLTISMIRNPEGGEGLYVAQIMDISNQKTLEDQQRLSSAVFNYSSQGIMVTDVANKIVSVNPAFTDLTGYTSEEVIGLNPNVLSSGQQPQEFYQKLWKSLLTSGHWEGDVWNRKKSGEAFAEWLSISTVQDKDGNVLNYVAIFSDITEKKKASDKILEYANYDALTELPNRRLFSDRLQQAIIKAKRSSHRFGLIFIDLDHFKEVNDELGHAAGDELLIQASRTIASKIRTSDTVARLGGDEFVVILNEIRNAPDLELVATSIVNALREPFNILGSLVHITGSLGLTIYPDEATSAEKLVNIADQAMYEAKQAGKNCYRWFSELN
jgi:diguanylate cyclase (GGDEF)-like protein/PAS domain S-box-containing protein